MLRKLLGSVFIFALVLLNTAAVRGQDDKPLAPGWLSLDGSVGLVDKAIADGKGSLEGALGVTIAGYIDTGYTWSSNHPRSPANISGRYFDKDYDKIVFNNFHLLVDKPEKDWGVGFRISGDFGRSGELLREATLWGSRLQDEPSAELREAYLTTTIPFGEGIGVKGGLFVTPLGTEILNAPGAYNENISRSFAFNFGVPLRHLGMLFSYPFAKTLTASAGIVTGWDNPRDNNNSPSGLAGINFTPMDSFALASNVIFGPEQTHNTSLGREDRAPTPTGAEDAWWHAFAGIASYAWTDRFTTALRGEVFLDSDAARTFGLAALRPLNDLSLAEVTLTGGYKFTKMLLGRAEVRQDWSDERVYQRGRGNADKNQTTVGVQLIYQF